MVFNRLAAAEGALCHEGMLSFIGYLKINYDPSIVNEKGGKKF